MANAQSLDEMIAETEAQMASSGAGQPMAASSQSGPSDLERMIAETEDHIKSGKIAQAPAKQVDDIGLFPDFDVKKNLKEIGEGAKSAAKGALAFGTGALQGGADVGYNIANIPNDVIDQFNAKYNKNIAHIPLMKPNAAPYDAQRQAIDEHPMANVSGELVGGALPMGPMFAPEMIGNALTREGAAKLLGMGTLTGFASAPSGSRTEGAVLGGALQAIPLGIGKGVQQLGKFKVGTQIDEPAVKAMEDVGLNKDIVPHVFNTTDDQAQKEYAMEVLPAAGNSHLRAQADAVAADLDNSAEDFLNSFNLTNAEGKSIVKEDGSFPSQTEMKENAVDKINKRLKSNALVSGVLYDGVDQIAADTGARVNLNAYLKKLDDIANYKPTSGEGEPSEKAVKFAKNELELLKSKGIDSDLTLNEALGVKNKDRNSLLFKEATDTDKRLNDRMGDNRGANKDWSYHRDLSQLKAALNNDIDASTIGNEALAQSWRGAKDYWRQNVLPFHQDRQLSQFLHDGDNKADPDAISRVLIKNDNPTSINKVLSLVPDIQDDLGILKLTSQEGTLRSNNKPLMKVAMQSIPNMSPDMRMALFGPEKEQKIKAFSDVYKKLEPLLSYKQIPKTGAQSVWQKARNIAGKLGEGGAIGYGAATGHLLPVLAAYAAKEGIRHGANRVLGNVMSSPEAFQRINSGNLLSGGQQQAYRTLLAGLGQQATDL
jgi:hypothetical protein